MNANATKIFNLLMEGPEWFDMGSASTCILNAIYIVEPSLDTDQRGWLNTREVAEWLGLTREVVHALCIPLCQPGDLLSPADHGPKGARRAALALQEVCDEAEQKEGE